MKRRRAPRIPVSLDISYDTGKDVLSGSLLDLGEGGVFISTPRPLEEGSPLRLCFPVPEREDSLVIEGTVVWRQDAVSSPRPGMGVRFEGMDEEDRRHLDRFLAGQEDGGE